MGLVVSSRIAVRLVLDLESFWQPLFPAKASRSIPPTPLAQSSLVPPSRSFSELETLGLITIEKDGRSRELHLTRTPKETWESGRKFWRTPVRKSLRVFHDFPIPDRSRVM